MKHLGHVSYLQKDPSQKYLRSALKNKNHKFIKAVDEDGQILGGLSCFFKGFEESEVPHTDPGFEHPAPTTTDEVEEPLSEEKKRANAIIDSLDAMEDADMSHWQNILSPPGSKCIILTGLNVAPQHQRKGVGSALMKWVTDEADKHGVYMWVHSSEGAYKVYLNSGFEVVGTLDVDLDAYSPGPPPGEGEGAIWGHYVLRYMKRLPKTA
jgi:GNAT superfamily N-acetyltransferase